MMDLRKTFQNLPQPVQNWLTSDTVTAVIVDINRRLDLEGELLRILPTVILRLVVKDIKPENFIPELSKELDLDFSQASAVAKDVEEKILGKIETILRTNVGIDTKLIYNAKPEILSPKIQPPAPPAVIAPVTPPLTPKPAPPSVPPQPIKPAPSAVQLGDQSFDGAQDKPFIIYQERPEMRETPTLVAPAPKKPEPPKPPEVNPVRSKPPLAADAVPSAGRTSNGVKIPIKTPPVPSIKPPTLPTPPQSQPQRKPGEVRMVHYSNFRTPLT